MGEKKFQYKDETDRQTLIDSHSNQVIVEEDFLEDGNYIIFDDQPRVYDQQVSLPKNDYDSLKQTVAQLMISIGGTPSV